VRKKIIEVKDFVQKFFSGLSYSRTIACSEYLASNQMF